MREECGLIRPMTTGSSMTGLRTTRTAACLLVAAAVLGGCGKRAATAPTPVSVTALLSEVSIGTSVGEPASTGLPSGSGLAPSVVASDSFVAGSNALLIVSVPDSASALLVGAIGHPGHLRIALTAEVREAMSMRARKLDLAA